MDAVDQVWDEVDIVDRVAHAWHDGDVRTAFALVVGRECWTPCMRNLARQRQDREDTSAQQAAVLEARESLAAALDALAEQAQIAARRLRRPSWKAHVPASVALLAAVHATRVAVERGEAILDHADRDLASASGEDV